MTDSPDDHPACWDWTPPTEFPGVAGSIERFQAMNEWHAGRCAGCQRTAEPLVNDHDHYTGLSRGLLCHGCNTAEGMSHRPFWENYRLKNPASIWKLKIDHVSIWPGDIITDPLARIALEDGWLTRAQVRDGIRPPKESLWKNNAALKLGL